jgi:PAS domain-containing protein
MVTPAGASDAEPGGDQIERARSLVDQAIDALSERDREIWQLQELLESVLASCPPLAVVEDGVVRAWSRSLERVTAVTARAAIGRRLTSVLPALSDNGSWRDPQGGAWSVQIDDQGAWRVVVLTPKSTTDIRS